MNKISSNMDNEGEIILALDISTSCIGISVLNNKAELLDLKHIKLKTDKDVKEEHRFLAKANVFKDYVTSLKSELKVNKVIIEEPLPNSLNRNTVNVLMKFNGVCSYIIMNELDILPTFISVRDVRKIVSPELVSIKKVGGIMKEVVSFPTDVDKKHYIFEKVNKWYPNVTWLYDKNGKLKDENYDMTDSLALGLAYLIDNKNIEYKQLIKK